MHIRNNTLQMPSSSSSSSTRPARSRSGRRSRKPQPREQNNPNERQGKTEQGQNGLSRSDRPCRDRGDPVVDALLCGVFLSQTSPLRVLSRDRDALALVLRTHRNRNLLPSLDWSVHGFSPGVGRDNRMIGGDAGRARGVFDGGDEDHQAQGPPTLRPLLPPPLVWGLPPADQPMARTTTPCRCCSASGPPHDFWRCCDMDLRWDGDWKGGHLDSDSLHALAGKIRRETAAQWAYFEEYVLRFVGRLSRRAWDRAVRRAKERAREGVKAEVDRLRELDGASGRSTSSRPAAWTASSSLLAAAEEEARIHALVAEALHPELIEEFHVNMLPIEIGHYCSLPLKCRRYAGLIELCLMHCPKEFGKVGYLTIDERWVEPGDTQRRPGLHIEAHCDVLAEDAEVGASGDASQTMHLRPEELWGSGVWRDILTIEGGLFLASNVSASCRVWDCVLRDPCSVVGPHGSVEHLRSLLDRGAPASLATLPIPVREPTADDPNSSTPPLTQGDAPLGARTTATAGTSTTHRAGKTLAAHELVWMTDRTPHEALPTRERVFRQFFRLVTSNVTVWYADHSTRNDERGVVPPKGVRVVHGDKFAGAGGSGKGKRAAVQPLKFV
ncbi:hypothetical protein DFJ73DRAFT_344285 [Zopfochytrium polystomum]|nr:hypothetical protein DFJ73DRAFT_344285 [Zopfochytrium polystomum]